MTIWVFAIGTALLAAALLDVLGSLLGDSGRGGWMTGRLGRLAWRLGAPSRLRGHHRPAVLLGRFIVLGTPTTWIVLLWAGWSLVFASGDGIVDSATAAPAPLGDTVYFTGYTLFTLGNGELRPEGTGWQLATSFATLSGFALLTMAVTYIVPIIQSAGSRRKLAALIARHGTTVDELDRWLGEADGQSVDTMADSIAGITESHATFPALTYLHTPREHRSAPAMVALIGVAAMDHEPKPAVRRLRAAIERYVEFDAHTGDDDRRSLRTELEALRAGDGRPPPGHPSHAPEPPGSEDRSAHRSR